AQGVANRIRIDRSARVWPPITRFRPIVIVGLHRTGTTLLQRLLGAIPGFGHVPLHRLGSPVPIPFSRLRATAALGAARVISPEMWVVHPVSADGPEECW